MGAHKPIIVSINFDENSKAADICRKIWVYRVSSFQSKISQQQPQNFESKP
ncbi:11267_t:CDS:2 [Rhizophagus irregularis]|nr:11267_t:CDS:2 [Rhizophagus irregularis]